MAPSSPSDAYGSLSFCVLLENGDMDPVSEMYYYLKIEFLISG
jgi:hypothetical protein